MKLRSLFPMIHSCITADSEAEIIFFNACTGLKKILKAADND